jgi:hypothetical protein
MSGGLFTNQLLRETEVAIDPERIERLRRAHPEAYQRYQRDPPAARQAARLVDGSRNTLGNRHQRRDGNSSG